MEELVVYLITFTLVYLIYLFFVILKKNKKNKFKNSTEIKYLEKKYNIDIDKISINKLVQVSALSNAFIVANTVLIIGFINNFVLKLLVGFVVLFPMIIIVYHLIGKYYQRSQRKM